MSLEKYLEDQNREVLCGANSYEQKYYFNEKYNNLPSKIKKELNVLCVLFTEEVGGIFLIGFDEDGDVFLSADPGEEDIYYDEISAGLMVGEVRRKRAELFEQLQMYYRLMEDGEFEKLKEKNKL